MWLGHATMGSQRSEKRCSRPVSRILSRHRSLPFGSNDREDDHSSSPGITDGIQQPTRKPQAGRLFSRQERSPRPKCLPIWSCSVWGFACRVCYQPRGALLPHLFTLTRNVPIDSPGTLRSRASRALSSATRRTANRSGRAVANLSPPTPEESIDTPQAVSFLCHYPSGCPARVLPGALPCGVRTFLSRAHFAHQGP
jgi:hypothetical protein